MFTAASVRFLACFGIYLEFHLEHVGRTADLAGGPFCMFGGCPPLRRGLLAALVLHRFCSSLLPLDAAPSHEKLSSVKISSWLSDMLSSDGTGGVGVSSAVSCGGWRVLRVRVAGDGCAGEVVGCLGGGGGGPEEEGTEAEDRACDFARGRAPAPSAADELAFGRGWPRSPASIHPSPCQSHLLSQRLHIAYFPHLLLEYRRES